MAAMIPQYPNIIPELDYTAEKQTEVNNSSLKYKLLSTFFYKRVEENNKIYLQTAFTKKKHYMPLFTMTKALAHYNEYCETKDTQALEKFKEIAKELIATMDQDGRMWGWKHNNLLQLPGYPKKYTSYSCLHNGRGLGVLIRYCQLHPSLELLDKIRGVLRTYEIRSDEGGVVGKDGHYLEYSWGDESPVVWNGFMSAIIGLHDVSTHGPQELQEHANKLYKQGVKLLIQDQEKLFWQGTFFSWIRYDTNKLYFADGPYLDIETRQLQYLAGQGVAVSNSLKLIEKIHDEHAEKASIYEYYYFLKKKVLR